MDVAKTTLTYKRQSVVILLGFLTIFGLHTISASFCSKVSQKLMISVRVSENGSDINCGDQHVIFISGVQGSNNISIESIQEYCHANHSCDITHIHSGAYVEYYCIKESLISGCEEIVSKHKIVEKSTSVHCYKYTQGIFRNLRYPCGVIPNSLANNKWLILYNDKMYIKTCVNCTTDIRSYHQYNIPSSNRANKGYLPTILYDCKEEMWMLHTNSDDCDGIFEDYFLKSSEFDIPVSTENQTKAENITGSYTTEVETVSYYVDTTSLLPSQELSSHAGPHNVDKRMFPREVVNYLTIGIAGGLTLITLTICLIVILKRSKEKSVENLSPAANSLHGCPHHPENFDNTSPEEENTYFTVEADDNECVQKKVEENTYNSIDEVKGYMHEPCVERYSKLKSSRNVLEKTPSFSTKDNYDQIVEELIQGRKNSTCPRVKKTKNSFQKKTSSLRRQTSKDSKVSKGSQEDNETELYNPAPSYQCSSLSPEYYDRALPVEPSAPPMESDSASEADVIYERVDDLLSVDEDKDDCSQVNDIYETVTEPQELKSQYSTFPKQTNGRIEDGYTKCNSLKHDNKPAVVNGNLHPPRIYDHITDKSSDTNMPLDLIPADEYVYTHLQTDANLVS
ncbi:uncharacterized protein LOC115212129 [Argonauta hians]